MFENTDRKVSSCSRFDERENTCTPFHVETANIIDGGKMMVTCPFAMLCLFYMFTGLWFSYRLLRKTNAINVPAIRTEKLKL